MSVLTANRYNPPLNNFNDEVDSTVTEISVIARIEYILRFSKNLVGVINENIHKSDSSASEYIESLSQEDTKQHQTNIAFLFSSIKLNDIQFRCRIIDQLFTGCVFDPEMPLSVSVIKLSKKYSTTITIVIEQAELLSTPILVELTQLASLAKKSNLPINVVIFGDIALTHHIADNKETFVKKVTLISGENGQIINLNKLGRANVLSSMFNQGKTKVLVLLATIVTLIGGTLYALEQYTTLGFLNEKIRNSHNVAIIDTNKPSVMQQSFNENEEVLSKTVLINSNTALANSNEIYSTIISSEGTHLTKGELAKEIPQIASPLNIASVLESETATPIQMPITTQMPITNPIQKKTESSVTTAELSLVKETLEIQQPVQATIKIQSLTVAPDYYLSVIEGNAVQLISFNNEKSLIAFKNSHIDLELYSFKKRVNGDVYYVLTSKVFETVTEANNFIDNLPRSMKSTNPWLIPIKLIHQHIQAF